MIARTGLTALARSLALAAVLVATAHAQGDFVELSITPHLRTDRLGDPTGLAIAMARQWPGGVPETAPDGTVTRVQGFETVQTDSQIYQRVATVQDGSMTIHLYQIPRINAGEKRIDALWILPARSDGWKRLLFKVDFAREVMARTGVLLSEAAPTPVLPIELPAGLSLDPGVSAAALSPIGETILGMDS